MGALLPVRKEDMSYEERRKALKYLMFLKEKTRKGKKRKGKKNGKRRKVQGKSNKLIILILLAYIILNSCMFNTYWYSEHIVPEQCPKEISSDF